MLGLLNRFLKDETMAINPWIVLWGGGYLLILFVPHSVTTFFNRGGKAVALTSNRKTFPM